ncbi:MAG TPA: hypothetical protein ENK86_03390 [Campylobacterales bacterium]|nr:hypothetical protein [Campylobacterales bacterium]
MIEKETSQAFDVEKVKAEIEQLLITYRNKKEELDWADDDWEVSEIQEELDGYANKIRLLKNRVKEFEHAQEQA